MMKKTASALAAAALMGTGAASAATFQISDDTALSVYGNIQLKYTTEDVVEPDGDTEDASQFADNGSTIGFAAEHRFDNGLVAYGRAEFEHEADEAKEEGGLNDGDQAYLGLEGDFGALQAGSWDGIYTDSIYDLVDPFETVSFTDEGLIEEGDQIAYFSPNFGGFSFEAQAKLKGDGEDENPTDDEEVGFAFVGKYALDNWAVHVGYDDRAAEFEGGENLDEPIFGIGGALDLGQVALAARYALEERPDGDAAGDDIGYAAVLASVDYGPGDIYGGVQDIDPDEGDGRTEVSVGANYNIGPNLYVFAEYGDFDRSSDAGVDDGEIDSIYEVGAIYSF